MWKEDKEEGKEESQEEEEEMIPSAELLDSGVSFLVKSILMEAERLPSIVTV